MKQVPITSSPITTAWRAGLEQSRQGMRRLVVFLGEGLSKLRVDSDGGIEKVMNTTQAGEQDDLAGIAGRIQSAIAEVPAEHFDQLERHLAEALGESWDGSQDESLAEVSDDGDADG
jgi:hypothetical protein